MENNFDHIERYFNGTMDQDEKAEFEKRRLVDKEFEKDVFLYSQAGELVRVGAGKRLKQHLDDLGRKEFAFAMVDTFTRYSLLKKYWYAIAASILIIIGLSYFAYYTIHSKQTLPTLARLYDTYFEIPGVDLVMSRGDNADEALSFVWNSAIRKYNDGIYKDAIGDFKALLDDSAFTHASTANFYLGVCYLTINFPDSAVSRFSNVSPVSSLSQDASWYLGLSYLKAGNSQKAAGVFESITKMQKHYKKEQAKEIFRQLSNMK